MRKTDGRTLWLGMGYKNISPHWSSKNQSPHHTRDIKTIIIFDKQVYLVVSLRWSLSCFWCSGWWTVHFLWGSEECFQPVDVSIHLLVDVHARLPCTTYRHCACPETDFLGRSCRKGRGYGWGAWRSVFRARVRQHWWGSKGTARGGEWFLAPLGVTAIPHHTITSTFRVVRQWWRWH